MLGGRPNGRAALEDSLVVSYKLSKLVQYEQAIVPLGIFLKELKTFVHTETCPWVFTDILFIIAKHVEATKISSVGEQVNELWSLPTVGCYSALKRKERPWKP